MSAPSPDTLFDQYFYAWSRQQAEELRQASGLRIDALTGLDRGSLADEIEELEMSELDELFPQHKVLIWHLSEWKHQPDGHSTRWQAAIVEQRFRIARASRENPSLRRPRRLEEFSDVYPLARNTAAEGTGLSPDTLPEIFPFVLEEVEDDAFWPGPDA